jgi:hypothetical protein
VLSPKGEKWEVKRERERERENKEGRGGEEE